MSVSQASFSERRCVAEMTNSKPRQIVVRGWLVTHVGNLVLAPEYATGRQSGAKIDSHGLHLALGSVKTLWVFLKLHLADD